MLLLHYDSMSGIFWLWVSQVVEFVYLFFFLLGLQTLYT